MAWRRAALPRQSLIRLNSHKHPTRVPPYLFGNDGGDGGAKAPPRGEALEFVEGVVCSLTGSIDDNLGPNWPRRTSCFTGEFESIAEMNGRLVNCFVL